MRGQKSPRPPNTRVRRCPRHCGRVGVSKKCVMRYVLQYLDARVTEALEPFVGSSGSKLNNVVALATGRPGRARTHSTGGRIGNGVKPDTRQIDRRFDPLVFKPGT